MWRLMFFHGGVQACTADYSYQSAGSFRPCNSVCRYVLSTLSVEKLNGRNLILLIICLPSHLGLVFFVVVVVLVIRTF